MTEEYIKTEKNTLAVTRTMPVTFEFTPEYLTEQRQKIVDQKNRDNAQRDLEIAEVDKYLSECAKLGIEAAPAVEKTLAEEPAVEETI